MLINQLDALLNDYIYLVDVHFNNKYIFWFLFFLASIYRTAIFGLYSC
jgi:hypothetical protein